MSTAVHTAQNQRLPCPSASTAVHTSPGRMAPNLAPEPRPLLRRRRSRTAPITRWVRKDLGWTSVPLESAAGAAEGDHSRCSSDLAVLQLLSGIWLRPSFRSEVATRSLTSAYSIWSGLRTRKPTAALYSDPMFRSSRPLRTRSPSMASQSRSDSRIRRPRVSACR